MSVSPEWAELDLSLRCCGKMTFGQALETYPHTAPKAPVHKGAPL
jgi:hypothetical protein